MKVSIVLEGTKQEICRAVDYIGWERKDQNHPRHGWSYSRVTNEAGDHIGNILPATRSKGCVFEFTPTTAENAATVIVAAYTSGAVEKMKGDASNENR